MRHPLHGPTKFRQAILLLSGEHSVSIPRALRAGTWHLHKLGRTVDGHVVLLEEIGARIGEDSHPAHGGGDSGVRINEPSGMIHACGVFAPSWLAALPDLIVATQAFSSDRTVAKPATLETQHAWSCELRIASSHRR